MSCNRAQREPLSQRERDALDAIIEHYRATGVSPSQNELRSALGLGQRGFVRRLVGRLCDKGFIEVSQGERRAIRVLFTADGQAFDSNGERMRALEDRVLALGAELAALRAMRRCDADVSTDRCVVSALGCRALRRCPRRCAFEARRDAARP